MLQKLLAVHGFMSITHTYTHSVLTAIFPVEPGLPVAPLILLLHLFLDCASFLGQA